MFLEFNRASTFDYDISGGMLIVMLVIYRYSSTIKPLSLSEFTVAINYWCGDETVTELVLATFLETSRFSCWETLFTRWIESETH